MPGVGKTLLFLIFLALFAGCQPVDSFQPLYQDNDVVFDSNLLGKWVRDGGALEFLRSENNTYDVIFTDDSNPQERMLLIGRLVNLEGHRFLDLTPKHAEVSPESISFNIKQEKNGVRVAPRLVHAGTGVYIEFVRGKTTSVKMQWKLVHWFYKVTNDEKRLKFDYIDDDKLGETLEKKTVEIDHLRLGPAPKGELDVRHLAVTAKTSDLQKFVLEHVNDDRVFTDSVEFERALPKLP